MTVVVSIGNPSHLDSTEAPVAPPPVVPTTPEQPPEHQPNTPLPDRPIEEPGRCTPGTPILPATCPGANLQQASFHWEP